MKRALAVVLTIVATVAVLTVGTGVAEARTLLFSDSFSSSTDPAWTFVNRYGEISGGQLRIDGNYQPGSVGRDGWAATHVNDTGWQDYLYNLTWDSSNSAMGNIHMAMLFARVQSATAGNESEYRIDVWDKGSLDPSGCGHDGSILPNGLIYLVRIVHGVGTFLALSCDSNSVIGKNFAEVKVQGSTVMVSVNGRSVLNVTDPAPLTYGGVGVGSIWETEASFDNVRVRSIP